MKTKRERLAYNTELRRSEWIAHVTDHAAFKECKSICAFYCGQSTWTDPCRLCIRTMFLSARERKRKSCTGSLRCPIGKEPAPQRCLLTASSGTCQTRKNQRNAILSTRRLTLIENSFLQSRLTLSTGFVQETRKVTFILTVCASRCRQKTSAFPCLKTRPSSTRSRLIVRLCTTASGEATWRSQNGCRALHLSLLKVTGRYPGSSFRTPKKSSMSPIESHSATLSDLENSKVKFQIRHFPLRFPRIHGSTNLVGAIRFAATRPFWARLDRSRQPCPLSTRPRPRPPWSGSTRTSLRISSCRARTSNKFVRQ